MLTTLDFQVEIVKLSGEIWDLKEENSRLRLNLEDKEEEIRKLSEEIEKRDFEIRELKEENEELRLEIYGLKKKKRKKSSNSKRDGDTTPKKRGPPFGHKGASRKKPEKVDKTVILKFETCPFCNGDLRDRESEYERFVEEIVPIPIIVIEYILKGGYCQRCKRVVYPKAP